MSTYSSSESSSAPADPTAFVNRKKQILGSHAYIDGVRETVDPSLFACVAFNAISSLTVAYFAAGIFPIGSIQFLLIFQIPCVAFHSATYFLCHNLLHLKLTKRERALIGYLATAPKCFPFYVHYLFAHKQHHQEYMLRTPAEIKRLFLTDLSNEQAVLLPISQKLAAKVPLQILLWTWLRPTSSSEVRGYSTGSFALEGTLISYACTIAIGVIFGAKVVLFLAIASLYERLYIALVLNKMVHPTIGQKEISLSNYSILLNQLCGNLGYHLEHHDVQDIDARYLPVFKKLAQAQYKNADKPSFAMRYNQYQG